jgi:hypothetical protein
VSAAVSGGAFSSRPRPGTPLAAVGDGLPYPLVSDLAMAVQRGYLAVGGVSQREAEEVRRHHSRSTLRVARSRSLELLPSPTPPLPPHPPPLPRRSGVLVWPVSFYL